MKITPWKPSVDLRSVEDLKIRLALTRLSDEVTTDWSYGTSQIALLAVIDHWQHQYDWDAAHARSLALPHFRAEIDGFEIHFLWFKSVATHSQPLLLMNGWPSSFVEYTKLAHLLVGPDSQQSFDVVIPALPGFGFSDKPSRPNHVNAVDLFRRLMVEGLGYQPFIASGTDIGAGMATLLALRHPEAVRGIHISAVLDPVLSQGDPPLSAVEIAYQDQFSAWIRDEGAYQHLQSTRPQTLAYALSDSPAGMASWILEKFFFWSDHQGRLFDLFPLDMLVDNLNVYWMSQTIGSSMRHYYESAHRAPLTISDRVTAPTAICMWPKDLVVAPREWAERMYNVVQYTMQPSGGHFPAWERPQAYAEDLRRFAMALSVGQP